MALQRRNDDRQLCDQQLHGRRPALGTAPYEPKDLRSAHQRIRSGQQDHEICSLPGTQPQYAPAVSAGLNIAEQPALDHPHLGNPPGAVPHNQYQVCAFKPRLPYGPAYTPGL